MNKTININLGGIFFHIDEAAYQKLKNYLDAVRNSLSDDPKGRDEILNDIELRIGELLSERMISDRQVINENDIDEIINIMGKPEDYSVDDDLFEEQTQKSATTHKKLFRDGDDKFLGGVCAGLSHYLGVEPIWIRIIWLILTLGFGIGFLVYIILWILIPEAKTTAEKLQMKGEPVTISNIERKIREEFQEVSSRVKDGVNDVTKTVKSTEFQHKAKSGLQEIIDALAKIILAIFTIIAKFIGFILIFVSSVTLIALLIGAFSWGSIEVLGFSEEFANYPDFFFDSVMPIWLLVIFTFLAIGIPFMVLFMLGLKILSDNVKSFSTTTKLSILGVWIIALLGLSFAGIHFATQKAQDGAFNEMQDLNLIKTDTVTIKMVPDQNLSNSRNLRRRYGTETVFINEMKKLYSSRLNVDVKVSTKETAFIKIRKESEGRNRLEANKNAESIEYSFSLNQKNLLLNGYFLSDFKNKFKDQAIYITLFLPENSIIYLDKSTETFLEEISNIQNIRNSDLPGHYFKVTKQGLTCLNCDPSIFGNAYKEENGHFKLNIDDKGVELNVKNGHKNAKVKINENGMTVQ